MCLYFCANVEKFMGNVTLYLGNLFMFLVCYREGGILRRLSLIASTHKCIRMFIRHFVSLRCVHSFGGIILFVCFICKKKPGKTKHESDVQVLIDSKWRGGCVCLCEMAAKHLK